MYIPKHYHWIFPVAFFMAGFWIWQNVKPQTFDVIIAGGVLMLHGIIYSGYLYQVGVIYQNYICAVNTPDPKPAPVVAEPDMPKVKDFSEWKPAPQFEQVVELPSFDMERYLAFTLLRMHENFPELEEDLTERKWVINTKKFSQKPFEALKAKWEKYGVIGRKSKAKNSRHVVRRWDALRLIASGNPLPASDKS